MVTLDGGLRGSKSSKVALDGGFRDSKSSKVALDGGLRVVRLHLMVDSD